MKWSNNCLLRVAALYLIALAGLALSISFELPTNFRKCLREEVQKNVLVTGEFEVQPELPGVKTDLHVVDARGQRLYAKEDAHKGKFAFTTDEYEMFDVCFETRHHVAPGQGVPPPREISLQLKHGIEAKNYEDQAKAEKLKPLELDLRKLEDISDSIVNDFSWMRKREEEMRTTNESTHSKVLYFSLFSMICLISLATWQILYLRRFFKAKKLIE